MSEEPSRSILLRVQLFLLTVWLMFFNCTCSSCSILAISSFSFTRCRTLSRAYSNAAALCERLTSGHSTASQCSHDVSDLIHLLFERSALRPFFLSVVQAMVQMLEPSQPSSRNVMSACNKLSSFLSAWVQTDFDLRFELFHERIGSHIHDPLLRHY